MRASETVKSNVERTWLSTPERSGSDRATYPYRSRRNLPDCHQSALNHLSTSVSEEPQSCCTFLHISLDFGVKRISIEISPPIQFRIEWADSQGMSPLLGCRPILFVALSSAPFVIAHSTHRAEYTSLPATIVLKTFVLEISSAGTEKMSFDSTARSASLPGSSVPSLSSENLAYVDPCV